MKLRARKHTVAWLGLVAMWLVVLAPLVSQLIAAAQADGPFSAVCSAVRSEGSAPAHDVSSDQWSACGYCDFFAHHVPAANVPPPEPVATVFVARAQVSKPSEFVPYAAFPSGRPRDPPAVS
ncbi:DUF2946 domain-containing protein [Paraburkholderia lacunae]|uniref:DUF2946 domain-containing protein n=2 Tax=Paraburkholderia lacunae TaxID=2211104 RepID=A0A370NBC2_9BURK|nr:DUF2946 domain-containing protein [Paraburkholderia lacunae]RDK02913.1 DUF2946 domain-containing protein [Paraburkholderia lacunae]